jgi:hypothetical protein
MRLIIARRRDLVTEQTRRVARLHDLLSSFHPGLERRLDLTTKAGLWLLTRYATPSEIRCSDENAIANHLREAGVRRPEILAAIASEAAHAQKIDPPGITVAAALCRQLAGEALLVRQQLVEIDQQLAAWLAQHPDGSLICSLPGMGVVLACEFITKSVILDDLRAQMRLQQMRDSLQYYVNRARRVICAALSAATRA